LSEIARRADPPFSSGSHVSRLLGRIQTPRCERRGRQYPPRYLTEISIDAATRIVRAADIDPFDVDGL
jgi:hypothetical protein